MSSVLTTAEERLEEIAVLHTRLALEHLKLFNIPGAENRLDEIKTEVDRLRKEREIILKKH